MVKFFWMPVEVWYYVIIPIVIILLIYLIFSLLYRSKKDSPYYNYVVDFVYSALGIIFCSLLFCLLLGYSLATLKVLYQHNLIESYLFLSIVLAVLPIVPTCFLIYLIRLFVKTLNSKDKINVVEPNVAEPIAEASAPESRPTYEEPQLKTFSESDFELKKKDN